MNTRSIITLILALVLIFIVMGVAAIITFLGASNPVKYSATSVWTAPFANTQSMKIMDTSDKQRVLFAQNTTAVSVFDSSGKSVFTKSYPATVVTTLGDLNGDNIDDIAAFAPNGVTALTTKGDTLWTVQVKNVSTPYRAAIVRFANSIQVILGDERGQVVSLDAKGAELWRATITVASYIRGLDDVTLNGAKYVAAATQNGYVNLYDEKGKPVWNYSLREALRRLRVYDLNGDGNSEILLGGDITRLVILDAANGKELFTTSLGQAITEIRNAEIDGNPSTHEFIAGGKDGGVWAYRGLGEHLWTATLSDKVTEIVVLNVDDESNQVITGDDTGAVTLFVGKSGQKFTLNSRSSGILRIDSGRLTSGDQIAVADGQTVSLFSVAKNDAPLWYTPLAVGFIISLVIAIAARFIIMVPPKPALRVSVEDSSADSLQAKRRMLHESLADVERMRQAGEVPGDAYLARLKELREQLAENEMALAKAGVKIKAETFKCPNCGGTLQLGVDKCDYCGNVVLT